MQLDECHWYLTREGVDGMAHNGIDCGSPFPALESVKKVHILPFSGVVALSRAGDDTWESLPQMDPYLVGKGCCILGKARDLISYTLRTIFFAIHSQPSRTITFHFPPAHSLLFLDCGIAAQHAIITT